MENVRIIFILDDQYEEESETSDVMLQAFKACKQNALNVLWEKEAKLKHLELNKTDFVVFENFSGKSFDDLKESKCARILGPWCISICLMEGRPIPNFTWPIYNVAMYDCVISCSHLPKTIRNNIKEKVQSMGGCYSDTLMSTNTHLITDSVKTEKYLLAAENGVKIMLSTWVDAVWEASQNCNVHSSDSQFDKHRCLPFHNLTICSTGIATLAERTELGNLIENNGGKLTAKLKLASTDILICEGVAGSTSEKYKAARNSSNVKCVNINWIRESIEKGYSLPHNLYPVKKVTSTPTKDNDEMNPNFSTVSAIVGPRENRTTFEESVNVSKMINFNTPNKSHKRKDIFQDEIKMQMDNLDVKKAKRAGQYLDGCIVYVTGFESEHRDKLCKVLNLSGATRYDDISERVTHVIVGDPSSHDLKIIKSRGYSCALVSLKWLMDSIENQQPVNEEDYLVNIADIEAEQKELGSPLSKKGLHLLRANETLREEGEAPNDTVMAAPSIEELQEDDTLAKLLMKNTSKFDTKQNISEQKQANIPQKEKSSEKTISVWTSQDDTSQPCDVFENLTFMVFGFEDDETEVVKNQIEGAAGTVVSKSFKGIPDFAVVPAFNYTELNLTATEVVNDLWISECIQEGEIREFLYYHKPHIIQSSTPLEGCVVTISSITGHERMFLRKLICALGGISQEQFARVTCAEKNIVGSTHLISLEASGKKYMAAIKWKLPVVDKYWLLECAKSGMLISEEKFLIGDAIAPVRSVVSTSKCETPISKQNVTSSFVNTPNNESVNKNQSRILTPITHKVDLNTSVKTPVNRFCKSAKTSPDACSQVTPVNKIMQEVRKNNLLGTPDSPPVTNWMNVKTPETPLGAFITPNPSPNLRKEMVWYLNQFPDFEPPKPKRLSTPLSELKRKLWAKIGQDGNNSVCEDLIDSNNVDIENINDDNQTNMDVDPLPVEENSTENILINNKLQQLENMLSASSNNRQRRSSRPFQPTVPIQADEIKDSEVFTVGWDYKENDNQVEQQKLRIFMISGIENDLRPTLVKQLESLGATISELASYDPSCTHLVCPKPARNEKTLSAIAGGKWILHVSYVEKSIEAGHFLDEEEYEFGNPKSVKNITVKFDKENELRIQSMYWWRQEITKRGYGAFNDMRAIVVAAKKDPIIRVIEAGGGVVIDVSPPFDDHVHATHCLLEARSVASNWTDYIPLAKQGIYCVNTAYISDYLHRTSKDVRDCILPYFTKYYLRD